MAAPAEHRKLQVIIRELGESSSLHGVPRILASRQIAVKFLWFLLLVGASALFGYQLYGLFIQYYSYPVKTSVSLQYDTLRLPAITLCNMNPIKQGQIKSVQQTVKGGSIDWSNDLGLPPVWPYPVEDPTTGGDPGETTEDPPAPSVSNIDEPGLSGSKDGYSTWKKNILKKIKSLTHVERRNVGHKRDEFILKSTFRGYNLARDNCITELLTTNYGNCFRINNPDFVARATGPDEGHELTLFLDINDYAENLTTGFGVRLVIHEPGTLPMPDVEGLTLNAGLETNVGIKLTHIDRLAGLYGECNDGVDFYKETGFRYSVPVCQALCRLRLVIEGCQCIPLDSPDSFYKYTTGLSVCDSAKGDKCMDAISSKIKNSDWCDCARQCSEDSYSTTVSSRSWPTPAYLQNVLLNESCTILKNTTTTWSQCYSSNTDKDINYNFVKVNIYYEDLNYAEILEEPLYDTLRFLSDIGGAMGLYMGASLLTYVELLQLLLEVGIYMQKRITSKTQKTTIDIVKN